MSDNTGLDSDVDSSTTEEGELEQEKRTVDLVSLLDRLKSPDIARRTQLNTNSQLYLARVNDLHEEFNLLDWWKSNASVLPNWSSIARKIMLLQPSSAAAERVFSLLKASFGEQQEACLQDYIEASLMLQLNKR